MSVVQAKPRLAFILLTYKQEKYVREAVRAALAQDYENLEVVVSDDASPDGTWGVIEDEVRSYRGPHRIILNRNQSNLGLIGNLYAAVHLTAAEYLVMAAGDDISDRLRAREVANAFASNHRAMLVTTDYSTIDKDGYMTGLNRTWPHQTRLDSNSLSTVETPFVLGSTLAYSRAVFDHFPPLNESMLAEDSVLPFRATILGGSVQIKKPLVAYRVHDQGLSHGFRDLRAGAAGARMLENLVKGFEQRIADLDFLIARNPTPDSLVRIKAKCAAALNQFLRWQAREEKSMRGLASLFGSVLYGETSVRDGVKIFLRVHFPIAWKMYVER